MGAGHVHRGDWLQGVPRATEGEGPSAALGR